MNRELARTNIFLRFLFYTFWERKKHFKGLFLQLNELEKWSAFSLVFVVIAWKELVVEFMKSF